MSASASLMRCANRLASVTLDDFLDDTWKKSCDRRATPQTAPGRSDASVSAPRGAGGREMRSRAAHLVLVGDHVRDTVAVVGDGAEATARRDLAQLAAHAEQRHAFSIDGRGAAAARPGPARQRRTWSLSRRGSHSPVWFCGCCDVDRRHCIDSARLRNSDLMPAPCETQYSANRWRSTPGAGAPAQRSGRKASPVSAGGVTSRQVLGRPAHAPLPVMASR